MQYFSLSELCIGLGLGPVGHHALLGLVKMGSSMQSWGPAVQHMASAGAGARRGSAGGVGSSSWLPIGE